MTDDGQAMHRPPPPPEAALIHLVRDAAGLKIPGVAHLAGISPARWSQIENGYESRRGHVKPVTARAVTLAHMAAAVGLSPERLETEGGRPDAAAILREIHRSPQPTALRPGDDVEAYLMGAPTDAREIRALIKSHQAIMEEREKDQDWDQHENGRNSA
jgi:transcriptional regulator with XRE-family HTH domain